MRFSERYGYEKPSDVIIRERITPEILNAIYNSYIELVGVIDKYSYRDLERYIQRYYLELPMDNIPKLSFLTEDLHDHNYKHCIILPFLKNSEKEWYQKIDIVEMTMGYLNENHPEKANVFINEINTEFIRLNFGYRIVDNYVIKTTSEKEIESIENAVKSSGNNVRMHIESALKSLSKRPIGDYRNSIKESISAVEAFSREITGENNLNFKKMETKGLKIPSILQEAFKKLYGYTNHADTGIRHSLMDETAEYVPRADEALYMLITCSAFINYLNSKLKPENKQQ